jgi:signal peptidase I
MNLLCRIYAILLYAYPREFRQQFGGEMQQVFRDRYRDATRGRDAGHLLRFLRLSVKDWGMTAIRERFGGERFSGVSLATMVRRPAAIWLSAIFLCLFASSTVVRAYVISAGSMESSLRAGDHVLADQLHSNGDIERGDLITFRYPQDIRQLYVKRVIGLPGDRIRIANKQVIRNGRRLVEPYAQHVASVVDDHRDNAAELVVPPDSFYVLGDNRDHSWDSRYWGFVPRADVVGKPWLVYWSYDAPAGRTRWDRTLLVLHSQPAQEVAP